MGIGFVLLIWLVVLLVLGSLGALLVSFITFRMSRSSTPAIRWTRTLGAFVYPFIMIGYLGASFLLYAVWCEGYRKVDPGLGDCWHAPIVNGYQLVFIDIPEKGSIVSAKDMEAGFWEANLSDISLIGTKGDLIYGVSDDSGYFLFNTKDKKLKASRSKNEWQTWLTGFGLSANEELSKTYDLYVKIRITARDWIAFGVMVLVGFLVSGAWWYGIWRTPTWMKFISNFIPTRFQKILMGERS